MLYQELRIIINRTILIEKLIYTNNSIFKPIIKENRFMFIQ